MTTQTVMGGIRRHNYAAYVYRWNKEGEETSPPDPRMQRYDDWLLVWGGHFGSVTSRDNADSTHHPSYAACVDTLKRTAQQCYIWYAYAVAPDGMRHTITYGAPYER